MFNASIHEFIIVTLRLTWKMYIYENIYKLNIVIRLSYVFLLQMKLVEFAFYGKISCTCYTVEIWKNYNNIVSEMIIFAILLRHFDPYMYVELK